MATPVRINEDNYAELQKEADNQRRSVVAQLNVILDERYGRYTAGNKVTPAIPLGGGKIITAETPPNKQVVDVKDLLSDKEFIGKAVEGSMEKRAAVLYEQDCCQNDVRPCKHWVWDTSSGEGYKNTLSGRFREAE